MDRSTSPRAQVRRRSLLAWTLLAGWLTASVWTLWDMEAASAVERGMCRAILN
ncbi:MAG: hypothetical protein JNL33_11750 [Betaproteobacteria bacterium]|nr:hypothetical protein [Betaproteobacteria bacterium]